MGFKSDITEYQEMLREYDRRGAEMRRGRSLYGEVYFQPFTRRTGAVGSATRDEIRYDHSGYGGNDYSYSCESMGCDGQTCGH